MQKPNESPSGPSAPNVADGGVVRVDLACLRCGYNLRGLSLDSRCPECNLEVAPCARGDLLRYADHAWVRRLAKGTELLVWGTVAVVVPFGAAIGAALALYAIWLLTAREPGALTHGGRARRWAIRAGFVVTTILLALPARRWATRGPFTIATVCLLLLAILTAIGAWVAFVPYLVKLIRRIPDHGLADRAQFLGRTIIVSLPFLAAAAALVPAMKMMGVSGPVVHGAAIAIAAVAGTAGLVLVGAFLFLLLLLREFARALRAQLESDRNANESVPRPEENGAPAP